MPSRPKCYKCGGDAVQTPIGEDSLYVVEAHPFYPDRNRAVCDKCMDVKPAHGWVIKPYNPETYDKERAKGRRKLRKKRAKRRKRFQKYVPQPGVYVEEMEYDFPPEPVRVEDGGLVIPRIEGADERPWFAPAGQPRTVDEDEQDITEEEAAAARLLADRITEIGFEGRDYHLGHP